MPEATWVKRFTHGTSDELFPGAVEAVASQHVEEAGAVLLRTVTRRDRQRRALGVSKKTYSDAAKAADNDKPTKSSMKQHRTNACTNHTKALINTHSPMLSVE